MLGIDSVNFSFIGSLILTLLEILFLSLTILAGLSIIWSTLVCGITPMPSSRKARQAMLELSVNTGQGPIYELGSGWGNLLIPLAKKYPNRKVVGYELSLLPWLTTIVISKVLGLNNVTVYRKNFLNEDLSGASVIFCYLFSDVMDKLERKIDEENICLEYLISNNFSLPSHNPIKTVQINDFYKSPILLYKF